MKLIVFTYRFLFGRSIFYKLNKLLYRCSLSGLGILNYENDAVSGEERFLKKTLKKGGKEIVFDVGANEGNYSSRVLSINPDATVYAFEPHPRTFSRLSARLARPGFHATNAAVGNTVGTMSLYDYASEDGSSHASLYKDVIEEIHKGQAVEHVVNIVRLKDFMAEREISHIDLLKIDTEGNELNVLLGLDDLIARKTVSAIHFEFNEMNVASRTYFRDFWNILSDYELYRLLPDGMVRLETYSPVFCEIFAYQNIVAILKKQAS